jgi:hypothetical protein
MGRNKSPLKSLGLWIVAAGQRASSRFLGWHFISTRNT